MIVSALVATKRFKVTENRDRADAILKGVALRKARRKYTPTARVRLWEARIAFTAAVR